MLGGKHVVCHLYDVIAFRPRSRPQGLGPWGNLYVSIEYKKKGFHKDALQRRAVYFS